MKLVFFNIGISNVKHVKQVYLLKLLISKFIFQSYLHVLNTVMLVVSSKHLYHFFCSTHIMKIKLFYNNYTLHIHLQIMLIVKILTITVIIIITLNNFPFLIQGKSFFVLGSNMSDK